MTTTMERISIGLLALISRLHILVDCTQLHLFYEQHALAIYRRLDVEECDLHNTLASIPNLLLALR